MLASMYLLYNTNKTPGHQNAHIPKRLMRENQNNNDAAGKPQVLTIPWTCARVKTHLSQTLATLCDMEQNILQINPTSYLYASLP